MFARVLSITILGVVSANYLQAESNYLKPNSERNNIVNKGVWVKKDFDQNLYGKASIADFIFRPNSLENDAVAVDFDAFNQNSMQDVPFFSTYIERAKRSPEYIRKRHPRKGLKTCVGKDCQKSKRESEDKSVLVESMFISDIKPNYLFHDHPQEVALLLNNNINHEINKTEPIIDKEAKISDDIKITKKRDQNYHTNDVIENKVIPKNEFNKYVYETDEKWVQNNLDTNTDRYNVIPKEKPKFTEKGLVKVISMLTKTFKKIMKQHNDIKNIHEKLNNLNDDFLKNVEDITTKFKDFDTKFTYLTQFNEKLKNFEAETTKRDDIYKTKEEELKANLAEFAKHQSKFLTQQKQFYALQRLLISQNEKITTKQNNIAKTQAEISHRQNNFARILQKAKQIIIDKKNDVPLKKPLIDPTTTPKSETVKINLLKIPTFHKIVNKDKLLIKEKDKPIDELVYKYYFNNTFIDTIMKSKILSTTLDRDVRQNKTKRNDLTTILLPIDKVRDKRWIKSKDNKGNDPFVVMATSFCSQIGQNKNDVSLNWCVEKALRRLQYMDTKVLTLPTISPEKENIIQIDEKINKVADPKMFSSTITDKSTTAKPVTTTEVLQMLNFPDNEELESSLKNYELKPDTEGNVYYDGSVHTSHIVTSKESEGFSDIMPDFENNSKLADMDPMMFDFQTRRRQHLKSFNQSLLKKLKMNFRM